MSSARLRREAAAMILNRVWWGLGFFLVLAAIVVCLVPGYEVPGAFELNDKISHLTGHAVLALYFAGLVPRRSWWKILLFLLVLGSLIEVAQYAMHLGRDGNVLDEVANAIGAVLGLVLARVGLARWPELAAWLLGQRRIRE
jgi:VanZ family protein